MLNGKLKNKIFLEKAPQDVVDKIKKRSLILVDEIDTKLKWPSGLTNNILLNKSSSAEE